MYKVLFILFSLSFSLLIYSETANAFVLSNVSDPQSLIKGTPYYNSTRDEIKVDYYGTRIKQTEWTFIETGTGRTFAKTFIAPVDKWYIAAGFTCIGVYTYSAKDSSGNELFAYSLEVEAQDLQNPLCESTDKDGQGDANNPGTPEGQPVETKCWTEVCKCIADLEQPINNVSNTVNQQISITNSKLDTINSNINTSNSHLTNINNKLDATNNNLEDLKVIGGEIKDEIVSLHDEFRTDKDYEIKDVPDISKLIDDNRPKENTTPFKDDTIYFKDEGDDPNSDPGPLPKAPEPKHWDGFLPEDALPAELEKTKEKENVSDKENVSEKELTKENENSSDAEFKKDAPMKQEFLQQDSFNQDAPLQQDTFAPQTELNKTHQYQQTNKYP